MPLTQASERAAVALMIFNRPALTSRVFDAIARARPPRLLVVADGPRAGHPDDARLCRETRAVIDRVDWPCDVLTSYSDVNLGCRLRIATGLQWVFEQVPEAIVVEDDCLPEPSFFRFCEELLERYRDEPRVHMISGCNVLEPELAGPYSYYFSRCFHVWGWATWASAWARYDLEMTRWPELRATDWPERHLGGETEGRIARDIFDATHAGQVPTWDFQWVFAGWNADAVSATPARNLVTNIGYGAAASHERDPDHRLANIPTAPAEFPLQHPPELRVNEEADRAEWRYIYPEYFEEAGDVVLGTAIGFKRAEIAPFLLSLRNAGYAGPVVLFVDRKLRRALAGDPIAGGVTLIPSLPWLPLRYGFVYDPRKMRLLWALPARLMWMLMRAAKSLPGGERVQYAVAVALYTPMEMRFVRYRRYLRSHRHRRVLFADVRDVLFQADPFADPAPNALAVGLETSDYTVSTEPHNAHWVERVYGREMLARIGDSRVANVGVTFGTAWAVTGYVEKMAEEILGMSPGQTGVGGTDTAVHNMLVWTGRLGDVALMDPLESALATLNGVEERLISLDEDGRLLNRDGSLPSIVHQYDRQPALRAALPRALTRARQPTAIA